MARPDAQPATEARDTSARVERVASAVQDPEVSLWRPEQDAEEPELSIVIPALNEQLTIARLHRLVQGGAASAPACAGEILIVDSSTDRTAERALAAGARVLRGAEARPRARVHRQHPLHPRQLRPHGRLRLHLRLPRARRRSSRSSAQGAEFIMGSRFRGYIEPGAMPPLHRYLGTPVTTWILNVSSPATSPTSTAACAASPAMRCERMGLRSQSWEYASEMVLKSVHMKLRTDEVPDPLPEGPRRAPEPPQALGLVFAVAGGVDQPARDVRLRRRLLPLQARGSCWPLSACCSRLPLSFGQVTVGPMTLSLYWMLLGLALRVVRPPVRLHGQHRPDLVRLHGREHQALAARFPYTRTVLLAAGLVLLGIVAERAVGGDLHGQRSRIAYRQLRRRSPRGYRAFGPASSGPSCSPSCCVLHGTAVATRATGGVRR